MSVKLDSIFCPGKSAYDAVTWTKRDARIINNKGDAIFELKDAEAPDFWSQSAVNVVASKYFYQDSKNNISENSVRQLVGRVVDTLSDWGLSDGYFEAKEDADVFSNELSYLLLNQYGSFNSPVWFNVGISKAYPTSMSLSTSGWRYEASSDTVEAVKANYEYPQSSACFIQSITDDMSAIMDLAKSEAMLFKYGSGTGTDLSALRSTVETIAGGGNASGPVSFLKIFDTIAGVVRSGGRIRRSAKLNALSDQHPDIKEFIFAKYNENKKAEALVAGNYIPSDSTEDLHTSVMFQNVNLSIKVSDAFMKAVEKDIKWPTKLITDPTKNGPVYGARELLKWMAECAHACGDPGVQFIDTINKYHTCANSADIRTSNPCQPGFATVLTPVAVRTFDDISVGSIIWSGKKWTTVVNKIKTGIKPVYCYTTDRGCFIGTSNHIVISKGKRITVDDAKSIDSAEYPSSNPYPSSDPFDGWGAPNQLCARPIHEPDDLIYSRTYLGDFPVYDITVDDPEHTYWTGGLLVSNCGEFLFIDDSACNLASLRLTKFMSDTGEFDYMRFRAAVRIFITAQDILINRSSFPTPAIVRNSVDFRPLGLGYSDLGALLMSVGLSYGSTDGQSLASEVTSAMTAFAYEMSAELAKTKGAFKEFKKNKRPMLKVLKAQARLTESVHDDKNDLVIDAWENALDACSKGAGLRNAQVTLLQPNGTVGFKMDCNTTGIEPELALVKYKSMVGGGVMKIVNNMVEQSLRYLKYSKEDIKKIIDHIDKTDTIENSILKPEHLPVFDCAFKANNGSRYLHWKDHINMMAAVQPFLSGAISKTVNLPADATVDTVREAFEYAWKQGLKSVTVYRDGCKANQPLTTSKEAKAKDKEKKDYKPIRHRLPITRKSLTHKFNIIGHEGYLTVGMFNSGMPGELFITMAKEGSTVGGIMDSFGTAISMCLQYGVPLDTLIDKFTLTRFDPAGITGNKDVPLATSIIDYIFKWLKFEFDPAKQTAIAEQVKDTKPADIVKAKKPEGFVGTMSDNINSGVICDKCGSMTVRNGSCFKCVNCGTSLGCS